MTAHLLKALIEDVLDVDVSQVQMKMVNIQFLLKCQDTAMLTV